MKQGRNLTVAERKHLQSLGLKYKHWLITDNISALGGTPT